MIAARIGAEAAIGDHDIVADNTLIQVGVTDGDDERHLGHHKLTGCLRKRVETGLSGTIALIVHSEHHLTTAIDTESGRVVIHGRRITTHGRHSARHTYVAGRTHHLAFVEPLVVLGYKREAERQAEG